MQSYDFCKSKFMSCLIWREVMEEKKTRKEQAIETRSKIYEAFKILLRKKDLEEINIQEICKKAEVSIGSFYHYFPNKAGMLVELYKELDENFTEKIMPEMMKYNSYDAIIKYITELCRLTEEQGLDMVKNVYKAQIDHGREFFLVKKRGFPNGVYYLVKKAIEEGVLRRDINAEELTEELLAIARGTVYYWCTADGEIDSKRLIDTLVSNYLKSYKV